MDARTRLRLAGQADLSAWVAAAMGAELWSIQNKVGSAASRYRARVAVPSCVASGKTYLAARLALAFYDSYTPGTPCVQCDGPCGGAKVVTLASKFEHLRDVLWGEIRTAYAQMQRRGLTVPGTMYAGQNLRLQGGPDHWIIGTSPNQPEGLQGIHGPHILVVGDEATALPEEITQGLVSSLATGDARLLLIFNPTDTSTWAYEKTMDPSTEVVTISAWDTPLFTGESVPKGSYLLTPDYVESMKASGFGPGTYDWQTKIEAEFWDLSDDSVISDVWYDAATSKPGYEGTRSLGIDLAPYGSAQNVVAFRDGNIIKAVLPYPSMRPDLFWEGPVTDAIRRYRPHFVTYDADGVGAGVIGYAEKAVQSGMSESHTVQLLPFRGALSVTTKFTNNRSSQWWALRRRFENGNIAIAPAANTMELKKQLTKLKYRITQSGDIRVETKDELKKRNRDTALDMGDAVVYAFAFSEELPIPGSVSDGGLADHFGLHDRSPDAMWRRDKERMAKRQRETPFDPEWI